jgi:hypothetical protein
MQTRCARLARSSVLGVRSSALIRYRVPGPRCQVPGTWNPVSGARLRKTRTRGMRDTGCRMQDAGKALAEGKARTCIPYPHFKT